jgi:hypothetical protein
MKDLRHLRTRDHLHSMMMTVPVVVQMMLRDSMHNPRVRMMLHVGLVSERIGTNKCLVLQHLYSLLVNLRGYSQYKI